MAKGAAELSARRRMGIALLALHWLICAAFILLRPADPGGWLKQKEEARKQNMFAISSGEPLIYLAERPLYQWNTWHGGENRWIKVVEIVNVIPLFVTKLRYRGYSVVRSRRAVKQATDSHCNEERMKKNEAEIQDWARNETRCERSPNMVIRTALAQDAAAICAIHQSAARGLATAAYSHDEIEAWVGSLTPASYAEVLREHEMVVGEEEGKIVAFGQLAVATAEIEAVYVSPSVARRGFGRAVLSSLEEIAKKHGVTSLHLRATLNAVLFYERAGYARDPEVPYQTPSGHVLRVVRMTKQLHEAPGSAA